MHARIKVVSAKINLFYCCCISLFVLVNGLSIRRDMSVARKLSTAVDLMSVDRDVVRNFPTVGRKSSPTALRVMLIDTGGPENNNTSSWASRAGGYDILMTRFDNLPVVNNAEDRLDRLRGEQVMALTNIQTSIATLSNSISTVGEQITVLDTKITALATKG